MMKKCSKCSEEKLVTTEFFHRQKRNKDGFDYHCKECRKMKWQDPERKRKDKARHRAYFIKNKEEIIARHKKSRRTAKEQLVERFGGKCVQCGYDRCPAGFDFHHIIPEEKEFSIGENCGNFAYERLLNEVEKCALLCSNCHRELHYYESEESSEVDRDSETTLPDLLCEEGEVSDVPLCLSVEEESADINWAEQG